jgi:protein gp37
MYRRFPHLGNPDFVPKFFPERIKELGKLKKPSKIFVCSCADLFAKETKDEWRESILCEIEKFPQHTYQLLTKRPQLIDHVFADNVWVGATVTCQKEVNKIEAIKKVKAGVRFVSFEPLLGEIEAELKEIDWIIIGKLTGSRKVKLEDHWVESLIEQAESEGIPIFMKNNLGWNNSIQEFPEKSV